MKKFKFLTVLFAVFAFAAMISCEGPEGPPGADGADGAAGADGTDGVDGVDANAHCVACHSEESWGAIEAQYAESKHYQSALMYNGQTIFEYAGGRSYCARCHSHQGFINYVANAEGEFVDIGFPTGISCETCHGNHGNLEESLDVPLRTTAAVTGISDGVVYDFEGNSNLCVNCHNARRGYDYYEAVDSLDGVAVTGDSVAINSTHAGPHYSNQVNMIHGTGGYGTVTESVHISLGCVSCHIGTANDANTAGGHTFAPSLANCTTCHPDAADFDIGDIQTDTETRMAAIAEALVTAGAFSGDAESGYSINTGIFHQDVFTAFWNYRVLYQDHSHGVHNPDYTEVLLTEAETALDL